MDHACAEAFIPIPQSLIDFYAEIGDGLEFGWSSKGRNAPFANHEICKLDACAPKSIDDVSWITEWRDDYEFAHVEDSALAKKTALKMRKWLPFWGIGNGDCLCLDTSLEYASSSRAASGGPACLTGTAMASIGPVMSFESRFG
jgi:hypothetical protein